MSTSNPMVTWPVARQMYRDGEPFRLLLHYRGDNWDNVSGHSSKWWSLEYDGSGGGPVACNYGKHGTQGRRDPFLYTLSKASDKVVEKLQKGYDYDKRTVTSRPQKKASPKIELTGPFALIRLVKKVGVDHFEAYDDGGEFLLDLNAKGAQDVVDADPFHIEMRV
jgi:predicted DNA-binding WGR domain protein